MLSCASDHPQPNFPQPRTVGPALSTTDPRADGVELQNKLISSAFSPRIPTNFISVRHTLATLPYCRSDLLPKVCTAVLLFASLPDTLVARSVLGPRCTRPMQRHSHRRCSSIQPARIVCRSTTTMPRIEPSRLTAGQTSPGKKKWIAVFDRERVMERRWEAVPVTSRLPRSDHTANLL